MIRRPPRSTQGVSSAASDVYKRQITGTPWSPAKCGCVVVRLPPSPSTLAFGTSRAMVSGGLGNFRLSKTTLTSSASPTTQPPSASACHMAHTPPLWMPLLVHGVWKGIAPPRLAPTLAPDALCALCSFLVSCTYFTLGDCLDLCLSVRPPASGSLFVLFFRRRLPWLPVLGFSFSFTGSRGCRYLVFPFLLQALAVAGACLSFSFAGSRGCRCLFVNYFVAVVFAGPRGCRCLLFLPSRRH